VQWRGNHAPTELAKILDDLGWALIVRQDGRAADREDRRRDFETPSNTPVVPGGMTIPNVERRAKTVVFTSAPLPAANTVTITGLGADAWRLVAQDKDGRWKTLDKLKLLNGKGAADVVRNRFVDVDEEFREQARQQLYRYVSLNPAKYPAVRFFRELHVDGEPRRGMEFKAAIPVDQGNGTFAPAQTLARLTPRVLIAPTYSGDGGSSVSIVGFRERVGTTDGASADIEADFKELASQDFEGRITIEAFVQEAADKPPRPKYAFVGFTPDSTLSADAARAALSSPDTVCVRVPDLLLLQEDGSDTNYDELVQRCAAMAGRYLANSGSGPRLHVFAGFAKVNLSGRVSEIRISQSPPLTKVKELTWWLPQSDYARRVKEILKEDGSGRRRQQVPQPGEDGSHAAGAGRRGRGAAGGAAGGRGGIAAARGGRHGQDHRQVRGRWRVPVPRPGRRQQGDGVGRPGHAGGADDRHGGRPAVQPGGERAEDALAELPVLRQGDPGGADREGRAGEEQAIAYTWRPHPHVTFAVDLTKDGGIDGDAGSMPNYTYTVKSLSGDELAKKKPPQFRFGDKGKHDPATRGLGYYDFEGKFQLLTALETRKYRQC
jgi:hypothetical protein